jgi:hypothetical protein
MQNDSIETLLLRHYGSAAPAPTHLEQRLVTSLRQNVQRQQMGRRHINRRQVMRLVAMGSAGIGILSAGIEGLQQMETSLLGQDINQPAFS